MYIRWIVRKHKNEVASHIAFHDAYLVESYRNEKGQPRQRTLAYLGNLRQIDETFPVIERKLFLSQAAIVLHHMPDLAAQDREKIIQDLHETVPPLTKEEMLYILRQNINLYSHWFYHHEDDLPSIEEMHGLLKNPEPPLEPLLDFANIAANKDTQLALYTS